MELNWIIFPAPRPPAYLCDDDIDREGDLIFIPMEKQEEVKDFRPLESPTRLKKEKSAKEGEYVPWYYMPYKEGSSKILIYFHGNAEDLGNAAVMMHRLAQNLKCHIIGVEYPGYGICFQENKNTTIMNKRALRTYEFLTEEFGYTHEDIIIFGRSLGSGVAVQLASKTNPSLLLLMSAYTGLSDVARDIWKCFKWCLKERFASLGKIKDINCPILFIHGEDDTVIRPHHSEDLYKEAMIREKVWDLQIRRNMDHNMFNFKFDIVDPILHFMAMHEISTEPDDSLGLQLKFWKLSSYGNIWKAPKQYEYEYLEQKAVDKSQWWWTIF